MGRLLTAAELSPANQCPFGKVLAALDSEDVLAVESWVLAGFGSPRIVRAFNDGGIKIAVSAVRNHLSGSCSCTAPSDPIFGVGVKRSNG